VYRQVAYSNGDESINQMAAGSRLPRSSHEFFFSFMQYTFQTHFVQLIKPAYIFARPTIVVIE